MSEQDQPFTGGDGGLDEQVRSQTGQRQVRLRIDESDMHTLYANAFRSHSTAEEVILDFGMNLLTSPPQQPEGGEAQPGEMRFTVNERIVLNYYTAKRLAMMLSQTVRAHEQRFGELKLNVEDRVQR